MKTGVFCAGQLEAIALGAPAADVLGATGTHQAVKSYRLLVQGCTQ
jgi:hypothetical protein